MAKCCDLPTTVTATPTSNVEHGPQVDVMEDAEAIRPDTMNPDKPEDQPLSQSPARAGEVVDIPALDCAVVPVHGSFAGLTAIARERSDSPEDFSFAMNFDVNSNLEDDLECAANDYSQLLEDTTAHVDMVPQATETSGNPGGSFASDTAEVSLQHGRQCPLTHQLSQHLTSPRFSPVLPASPHDPAQASTPMVRTVSAVSRHA